jgi:hypothetical protein
VEAPNEQAVIAKVTEEFEIGPERRNRTSVRKLDNKGGD